MIFSDEISIGTYFKHIYYGIGLHYIENNQNYPNL